MINAILSLFDVQDLFAAQAHEGRSASEIASIEAFKASLKPAVYDPVEGHVARIIYDNDQFTRTITVVEVLAGRDDLYLDVIWHEREEARLFACRKIKYVVTVDGKVFDSGVAWFAAAKLGLVKPK